jgi:hypothetical protein
MYWAQFYASSDIHVSASEFETLGNTVLEAFACKIPVVVSIQESMIFSCPPVLTGLSCDRFRERRASATRSPTERMVTCSSPRAAKKPEGTGLRTP